jgi:phosphatidylglycerophosphatase A
MNSFIKVLASGFGLGYLPYAPGTFGTLAGIPLFLLFTKLTPLNYIIALVILFFFSSYISKRAETIFKKKDASVIVIDEVAGFIVTMALIGPSLYSIVLGFVFFRFFDIIKIWPVRAFDKMSGGYAVVLDDIMAGIYANILLRFTIKYLPLN